MTTTSTTIGRAGPRPRSFPVPLPRSWSAIAARDVWAVVTAVGVVILAMWVRHGGLANDPLTAVGQLTALLGTYAALLGVLFAARAPWLDQVLGTDQLRRAHAILGFASVWAIGAHAVTSTLAFASSSLAEVVPTVVDFITTVPGMLGAVVGMGLFIAVAVSSMKAARRRMSYETWHGTHLYAYFAVAFGYLHQMTIGSDFLSDPLAAAFWIGLYVIAFASLLIYRAAWPIYTTLRHRPRVQAVVREGEDTFSLYVAGHDLDRLAVRSGQFFVIRALTRRDWSHGHPFSISAAPAGDHLRFTIKIYGEGTRALSRLSPGTPLLLEGPYGAMHGGRRTGRKLLLVGGGIGIAPIRALAEGFSYRPGEMDLIYRTREAVDAPLRRELETLAQRRGFNLHLILGRRGDLGVGDDPLGVWALNERIPDAAERDVFLCGPEGLMEHTRKSLLALGTPAERINLELFG